MALNLNQRYLKYFFEPFAESFEEGFWEAVKRRELVFQRCSQCGRLARCVTSARAAT